MAISLPGALDGGTAAVRRKGSVAFALFNATNITTVEEGILFKFVIASGVRSDVCLCRFGGSGPLQRKAMQYSGASLLSYLLLNNWQRWHLSLTATTIKFSISKTNLYPIMSLELIDIKSIHCIQTSDKKFLHEIQSSSGGNRTQVADSYEVILGTRFNDTLYIRLVLEFAQLYAATP